jgi:hypothetical protein
MMEVRACANCRRLFATRKRAQRYCSRECGASIRPRPGGNRRGPQTFRDCAQCGRRFGPIRHLSRRFCSPRCHYENARVPERRRLKPTPAARRAQRRVAFLIQAGRLHRPATCEECGKAGRVEAAHRDYARPADVRWLCISCHRRWDKAEPKGGVTNDRRWDLKSVSVLPGRSNTVFTRTADSSGGDIACPTS